MSILKGAGLISLMYIPHSSSSILSTYHQVMAVHEHVVVKNVLNYWKWAHCMLSSNTIMAAVTDLIHTQ